MRNFKDIIVEKLKVSKKYTPEIDFSWFAFIKHIYNNGYMVRFLDIQENNNHIFKGFYDLPEFKPNNSKPKYMNLYMNFKPGGFIIGLRVDDIDLRNNWLDIMYRLEENGRTGYYKVESFSDLKDFLNAELIIEIYEYLKQNA